MIPVISGLNLGVFFILFLTMKKSYGWVSL